MPDYEIRIDGATDRYLRRLQPEMNARIRQRLKELATDPYHRAYGKPLTNLPGYRSSRVGSWRIVFTVDEQARRVDVLDIAPRGDVYKHL